METKQVLANKINILRKQKNLTIEELSHKTNIDYSYLSKILRGNVNCSLEKLISLADTLGVGIKELFDLELPISKSEYIEIINKELKEMDEKQIKSVYKILYEVKNFK